MKRPRIGGVVNRILRVGIELEGGWDIKVEGEHMERDGSVKFDDPYSEVVVDPITRRKTLKDRAVPIPFPKYMDQAEVVSRPLACDIEVIGEWVRRCYPQHVNDTCGLHVHMSFYNPLNYSRLMTEEYVHYMVRELGIWGRNEGLPPGHMLFNRLNPTHPWTLQHCSHVFLADKQAQVKKKDYNSRGKDYSRYTFINYPAAQHQTVECRGLPMFGTARQFTTPEDAMLATRSIVAVIIATNRFLSKIRRREERHWAIVDLQPESHSEFGAFVR